MLTNTPVVVVFADKANCAVDPSPFNTSDVITPPLVCTHSAPSHTSIVSNSVLNLRYPALTVVGLFAMLPTGNPIALFPVNCTAPVPVVLKIMLALDDTAELLADIVTLLIVRLPTLPPPPGAETPNPPVYLAPLM